VRQQTTHSTQIVYVGRPAQRTQGSVPENQFRRPRPNLHGGRLTEILESLPESRETSTAPAREEEHHAAGSSSTRTRWTIIRAEWHRTGAHVSRVKPQGIFSSCLLRSREGEEEAKRMSISADNLVEGAIAAAALLASLSLPAVSTRGTAVSALGISQPAGLLGLRA
jgi:hypothetical protein